MKKTTSKKTGSKQEDKLYEAIRAFYPNEIERNCRPDFLKNRKTGKNLEIDIYLPEIRVGFEYQGAVHFQDIDRYKNDSDKSRQHDLVKYAMTSKSSSKKVIVEVFESDLNGDIKANVAQRILNTQKYYYYKGHFAKCAKLEMAYAMCLGVQESPEAKRTLEWFHACNNLHRKRRPKNELIADLFKIRDSGEFLNKQLRFRRLSMSSVMDLMGLNTHLKRYKEQRTPHGKAKQQERKWQHYKKVIIPKIKTEEVIKRLLKTPPTL